jgi:enamine deaminase RidA (YjgF/YER057c/UK114 family)
MKNEFIPCSAFNMPIAKIEIVNTQRFYDHSAKADGAIVIAPYPGRVAYISGQGGHDSLGRLSADFSEQDELVNLNLSTTLEAMGARPEHVAKHTTFVFNFDYSHLDLLTKHIKKSIWSVTSDAETCACSQACSCVDTV